MIKQASGACYEATVPQVVGSVTSIFVVARPTTAVGTLNFSQFCDLACNLLLVVQIFHTFPHPNSYQFIPISPVEMRNPGSKRATKFIYTLLK